MQHIDRHSPWSLVCLDSFCFTVLLQPPVNQVGCCGSPAHQSVASGCYVRWIDFVAVEPSAVFYPFQLRMVYVPLFGSRLFYPIYPLSLSGKVVGCTSLLYIDTVSYFFTSFQSLKRFSFQCFGYRHNCFFSCYADTYPAFRTQLICRLWT